MPKTVSVPSTLSGKAATMWRATFLDAFNGTCAKPKKRRGGSEVSRDACAAKVAWSVVKKSYRKSAGGRWVKKSTDPIMGPISPVPDASEAPAFGAGYDLFGPDESTKLQRWKKAFAEAMQGECRNADHPVECARAKANAATGRTDNNVEPVATKTRKPYPFFRIKGGPGSGFKGHAGRPGEVGGSAPSGQAPSGEAPAGEPGTQREGDYQQSLAGKKLDGMRKHKFLPKAIENKLPALYSTENEEDPTVWAKWFHPFSAMTWYATEYDPRSGTFFGYVGGTQFPELGYFDRREMEESLVRGLPIERDKFFKPKLLSEVRGGTERAVHRSLNMGNFTDYSPEYIQRREFDTVKRREMAKAGAAMSDGSFPISNCEDVSNAVGSLGRTSKPRSDVVFHIRKQAEAIGCRLTPALEQKVLVIERYLKRGDDRDLANRIDYQHIESFADTPIERPSNITSAVWRSLPPNHRTVRAEATRRIIERNYAQAVEDAEMSGWSPRVNQYHPEEYYFIKAWPTRDNGDVMIRAILVRVADSLDWSLMQMSSFASGSIAEMLPAGIFRHTNNHRRNLPLINKGKLGETSVSLPDAASGEAGRQKISKTPAPATTEQTKEILYGNDPDIPQPMDEREQLTDRLRDMNLGQIAGEIRKDWKNVSFGAVPYLEAMASLKSIDDKYFMDSGVSVVSFFLSNSGNWRGDTARAIRAELNRRIKRT